MGNQDVYGWNGKATAGYQLALSTDFFLTPTVGVDYFWTRNKGYHGTDSGSTLHQVRHHRQTSLELPVEVTLAKMFATGFGSLTPYVRGGWTHEFHDKRARVVVDETPAIGTPVSRPVESPGRQADFGTVGVGLAANVNGRADIFASWDYQWTKRYHGNALNLGAGITF
jgi:outer membrane autotransporter protein